MPSLLDYKMSVTLRQETPADHRAAENLTREAFWNLFVPGCVEHYLLHIMRDSGAFIGELDTVAEMDGQIVGNIVYTEAKILGDDGEWFPVISFGPIAVLPEFQGKGIGGKLIKHTIGRAKEMGYRAILIYGDPDYYGRFGFVQAEQFGVGTPDNMYAAPLQALELYPGALAGCQGRFYEDTIFDVDPQAADEFDKSFPDKERTSGLPTQARFQQLVGMRKPRA